MEALAEKCLKNGDLEGAAAMYSSLEHINPQYRRRVELIRVLQDPTQVPQPQRNVDICDALLDDHFPPDILLGKECEAEALTRHYQRLVVHVHPDKNPCPRAKDAFQRLGIMKEKAQDILLKRRAARSFESQLQSSSRDGSADREKHSPSAHFTKLSELKKSKITLTSLKRKPPTLESQEDPLSATARPASSVHHYTTRQTIDLASTVPSLPLHTPSSSSSKGIPRRPPGKRGGTKPMGEVQRKQNKSALPNNTVFPSKGTTTTSNSRSTARLPNDVGTSSFNASQTEMASSVSYPYPHTLSPIKNGKTPRHSWSVKEKSAIFTEPLPGSDEKEREEATVLPVAESEQQGANAEENQAGEEVQDEEEEEEEKHLIDRDLLREQISAMINTLGTLRRDSTNIRLQTNIHFSAYKKSA